MLKSRFALTGAALLLAAACGGQNNAAPAAAASAPADVWAVVNGRQIKKDDVEKAYKRISAGNQNPSEDEVLTAKLSLLNELIVQDLLVGRAQAMKIDVTDAEVDTAFAERKRNLSEDEFQKEMSARGLSMADMKDGLRRELMAQKVVEREVTEKIKVTDQEIADFYNANRAQFNLNETAYHIAQIVITPVRDAGLNNRLGDDATSPALSDRKMQAIIEKLKAGERFSEMARDYSEDPQSAPNGGDLGFVTQSQLAQVPPPLRNAVLKTEPGRMSVVSAQGNHTLVLLVAREPAGQRELNTPQVRDSITNTLRTRREQLLRTAYLTAARNDATVVNYLAQRIVDAQGKAPAAVLGAPGK
ncbi:MAG TPA: peptidylprolyl isomerase [Vicinamibacterales bacterium]|nr:peptidylprolyl isomerase [Vicinamibacterales bacterium]